MDTQKLKAAWKAKNDRAKMPVKVELAGIDEPVYVRLLKADESEHIADLREQATKDDEDTGTSLSIVGMLCHEDGRRLSKDEARDLFEMLVESRPTLTDWSRLFQAATGGADAGNSQSASPS